MPTDWMHENLDAVAAAARSLQDDADVLASPSEIFQAQIPSLRRIADFRTAAFYRTAELDFILSLVDPPEDREMIEAEVERQVDQGIFSWALYRNRPTLVLGATSGRWIVFHPLSTSSGIEGMFVGALDSSNGFLPDATKKALSILLLNCATVLESRRLHQEVGSQNERLERIVSDRTRELRYSERRAQKANRAKSDFLATMSHELRTPLNAIVGIGELLADTELTSTQADYVEVLGSACDNLLTLVNQTLDLSRIEAGHLELQERPFDLHLLAEEVVRTFTWQARTKGLELDVAVEPTVPRWVSSDPDRLGQVLRNLIGNAVKFTEEGGVLLRIRALGGGQPTRIRFDVRDTGDGIPEHERAKIFERFGQAASDRSDQRGGSGLGLTISAGLVSEMGGELDIESTAEGGSCFHFSLPLPEVPPRERPERTPPGMETGRRTQAPATGEIGDSVQTAGGLKLVGRAPGAGRSGRESRSTGTSDERHSAELGGVGPTGAATRPIRILLAEDTPEGRLLVESYLTGSDFDVTSVTNGREVVDAYREAPETVDLILMDVGMPKLGGLAATRLIREWEAKQGWEPVPILALTAHALAGEREKSIDAGMDNHLSKPIRRRELLEAVVRWARRRAAPMSGEKSSSGNRVHEDSRSTVRRLFRAHWKDRHRRILEAVERQDARMVQETAHVVRGGAAAAGLTRAAQLAWQLEASGRDSDWKGIERVTTLLHDAISTEGGQQ